jgi:sporulation protein YlmC with PRC-barrel domain
MIRTLLATTAVAAVLALPVIAQDASSSSSSMESSAVSSMSSEVSSAASSVEPSMSSSMDSSAMSSSAMDSSVMSSEPSSSAMPDASSAVSSVEQPTAPFDIVTGYTQIDSDAFATRIIGQPVYDSGAADANKLGDITDIVLNESGTAQAVIIGVGGFLGIGEKQVAVAYAALQKVVAADNTERYVVETTVEELTAAPDFVVVEDNAAEGTSAPTATDTPAATSEAPADAMATPSSSAQ